MLSALLNKTFPSFVVVGPGGVLRPRDEPAQRPEQLGRLQPGLRHPRRVDHHRPVRPEAVRPRERGSGKSSLTDLIASDSSGKSSLTSMI